MQLEKVLSKYPKERTMLIEILLDVQRSKETNFISDDEIEQIAKYVNTPESHVCSVMSFYTLLSNKKRGKHIIQVCKDVPCYVNDDFNVLKTVEEMLQVGLGQTTDDELFTLETTACIGCCDEAPAMRINDKTFTALTKEKVMQIIADVREGKQ